MRRRIALATSEEWPQLSPDDGDLIVELAQLGCDATPAVWSDPGIDWQSFDRIVIRSCWDYHLRAPEFSDWLARASGRVLNPADIVRWNMHKGYLLELESRGVRIPATTILRKGESARDGLAETIIVKPAISASAFETHYFPDASNAGPTIDGLAQRFDVIVQAYVPEVVTKGEWSLIYFAGAFSHAVRKVPKTGDFRVQQELGGSAVPELPPKRLIEAAERALDGMDVLYARVDLVDAAAGVTLMELELIEPSLFLKSDPVATRHFAAAIAAR